MPDLFADAGPLRAAYDDVDWTATSLGPVAGWSRSLCAAVDLALHTRFPVSLYWGDELVLIYNAAYAAIIGEKHPAALGSPAVKVFPEIWEGIGPLFTGVLAGEPATWLEDALFPLERAGFLEDTYFTFSFSPVRDDDGSVGGVINIVVETTAQVVTARRLAALARLNRGLGGTHRLADFPPVALDALHAMPGDVEVAELRTAQGSWPSELVLPAPPQGLTEMLVTTDDGAPVAWVPVTTGVDDEQRDAVLGLRLSTTAALDVGYLDFVRLLGSSLSRHLGRLVAVEAEHTLSAALQESLLTRPQPSSLVDVAVRYHPAALAAQVGGDWYDVFQLGDGATMVVVGDVTGHDHGAAATMGQLRNLLRGVAQLDGPTPSQVLCTLERATRNLGVAALATAVVGELRADADGSVRFTWSCAGHPPPVVVDPEGRARLLDAPANLILGIDASAARDDHQEVLAPGSTLVLYTDGLVERRREHLDLGLARLLALSEGGHVRTPDDLCDRLLTLLGEEQVSEDDVALLVVRVPQRRSGAGPAGG